MSKKTLQHPVQTLTPKSSKIAPSQHQNGAKVEPKWNQDGIKIDVKTMSKNLSCNKLAQETEKRTKMDTEWSQNGALLLQKCTNRKREPLAFSFSPKIQF